MKTDTLVWLPALPGSPALPLTKQPDMDVHWTLGVEGRFMPPVELVEDEVYGQAGSRLRTVKVKAREVVLPITVIGADEVAVRAKIRALTRAFDPTTGDGQLNSTGADGTTRRILARYAQGMEGREGLDDFGRRWQRLVLVLRATAPYWEDLDPTSSTFASGASAAFLGAQFLPLHLTNDTILGAANVTNDGDLPAYPIITVKGPATSLTITNNTTGEVIAYTAALAAADVLTIDTRPFRKTVRLANGTNKYGSLDPTSTLFGLRPGTSAISLTMPGATNASYLNISYRRQWWSA